MSIFTPKSRLEKILCGVAATARTRLEKAVAVAVSNAGNQVIPAERNQIQDAVHKRPRCHSNGLEACAQIGSR